MPFFHLLSIIAKGDSSLIEGAQRVGPIPSLTLSRVLLREAWDGSLRLSPWPDTWSEIILDDSVRVFHLDEMST